MNHSSESIHIWTIGTLEGWLSSHDSWSQGPCPRVGLEVKIWDIFKKSFSTFLLWKQLMQVVGQTWLSLMTLTCGSWSEVSMTYISQSSDFALYLEDYWHMYIILWDYESVWPQNNCRSLWPIFHGPVILHYIVKTIWCMNIILWDYGSVWPDIWPQNKWRSLWPLFYGPVILPCILKTIWCMNIIIWDYDSVWRYVWTQISVGHCDLYFMVKWFLPYILKTILCMNIIISDYGSIWPKIDIGHCDLYFMVQCFCVISCEGY